jgi:hypothetical protein
MTKKILSLTLLMILITAKLSFAVELESDNYKITGLSVNSGGDITDSTAGYSLLTSIGEGVLTSRINSSLYSMDLGNVPAYRANTPLVQCFETTTNGSTNCSDVDLGGVGMVVLCGYGGCIDKARFEIDAQGNPTDTLYSAQIKKTTDAFWSYIDGNTFQIEDLANHDINDFLTESDWEGTLSSFNVYGLLPNTDYQLRLIALHGDFTQSEPSPDSTAQTSNPILALDIDVADTDIETSAPYSIPLGLLTTQAVNVGEDFVWLDINTNSPVGARVLINDLNDGLMSTIASTTIFSIDNAQLNLASVDEGFGFLQASVPTQDYLGPLDIEANYDNLGNPASTTVGGLSTTPRALLDTSATPILDGRVSFAIKTKITAGTPAASDYFDVLTFTMLADL